MISWVEGAVRDCRERVFTGCVVGPLYKLSGCLRCLCSSFPPSLPLFPMDHASPIAPIHQSYHRRHQPRHEDLSSPSLNHATTTTSQFTRHDVRSIAFSDRRTPPTLAWRPARLVHFSGRQISYSRTPVTYYPFPYLAEPVHTLRGPHISKSERTSLYPDPEQVWS